MTTGNAFETVQEPMIEAPVPAGSSALYTAAAAHVRRLTEAGKLEGLNIVAGQLVLTLAQAASTARGYAAAQVLREFREAMALLPDLDDGANDPESADELDAAARRVGLLLEGLE